MIERQLRQTPDFNGELPEQQKTMPKSPKNTRIKKALIIAVIFCLVSIFYRVLERLLLYYYYDVKQTPRAKLEQPRLRQQMMTLWTIHHPLRPSHDKTSCSLISAGNIVTDNTVNIIKSLLEHKQLGLVYLMSDLHDVKSRILLRRSLVGYQVSSMQVEFDVDLDFLTTSIASKCSKLVYMFGSFKIDQQMATNIAAETNSLQPMSLYYTSNYLKDSVIANSTNLQSADLSQIDPSLFYLHLYIFDPAIVSIFAPINFGYYAKYTLEEAILIPALVYYQSASKMYTSSRILHSLSISFVQFKQFALNPVPQEKKSLCFISYPTDLYTIEEKNAIQYIESIQKQNLQSLRSTIIVYLPYRFNFTQGISKIGVKLADLANKNVAVRAKIKIMSNKTSPAHAVYESVYSYCPSHGIAISSRHNVRFVEKMAGQVLSWVSTRYHYYYFNFMDEGGVKQDLDTSIDYDYEFVQKKGRIFQQKLRHVQVFKTDLMKMVPFWILKSAQVDFYQTEAPFVFNMIQVIKRIKIKIIQQVLAKVIGRNMSSTESAQIRNIKFYSVYTPMIVNILTPYPFNSLQNPVHRRNAPSKIPPNLHQIWLTNTEISQARMALHRTMMKANPNFKMHLWKRQNITKENLPLTYNLITIIFEKNKQSTKSIIVMAADLMRYELVLKYGGIYVDFKWQGNKPLDNFLKYESFFIDFDIEFIRFGRPKALGNGFMGSTINNYHLKTVLTQLLNEQTLTFGRIVPYITGGWVVRNAFTDYEVFTQIGLGYHFFVPSAYQNGLNFCSQISKELADPNEQEYKIQYNGQEMKIVIPCRQYPESYGVLYNMLAGTWKREKAEIS